MLGIIGTHFGKKSFFAQVLENIKIKKFRQLFEKKRKMYKKEKDECNVITIKSNFKFKNMHAYIFNYFYY